MNVFCRMLFFSAILLLVCRIGADTLMLQETGGQTVSIGWMEEAPGEEDTVESDDDDDAIGFQVLMPGGGYTGLELLSTSIYAHVLAPKVTTPPPKV